MWLYVVLLHETVLLVPNLCLQYLAFQFYEFLKVTGLKFGCDSSKTPILTVFGVLLVIKRLGDHFICVILVVILETSRLVPWFRQLDHPIQRYHAPRARENKTFSPQSQRFVFKFCHLTFSRVNHTCLTHCNRFQMPHYPISPQKYINVGLIPILLQQFKNHQI